MSDTFTIHVQNMSHDACAVQAQKALDAVEGLEDVTVSFADESARFSVNSAKALKDAFTALERAGYPGALSEDKDAAAHREEKENTVVSLRRATLLAAALALPVFTLETGSRIFPEMHHAIRNSIGIETSWQVQSVLTTILLIGPGLRFFRRGIPALFRGAPDMNSLVALGIGAAYLYSVFVLAAPELLPVQARAVYFEYASVIIVLTLSGGWLEARIKNRTGATIERLIALRPERVCADVGGEWVERPTAELIVGQKFMVRAGERIAADGQVISGHSDVDQSMFTGEQRPVAKGVGDEVAAGTINTDGTLVCCATTIGSDSKLARIIARVETAQGARVPVQTLVNQITLRFVPAVLVIVGITMAVWWAIGPEPKLPFMLVVGMSVLIIACPCAIALATPTSIMMGAGRAAELGILFRTGTALQHLQGATLVVFDMTGGLTEGRPKLIEVIPANGDTSDDVLTPIAAVEAPSQHCVARAILEAAEHLTLPEVAAAEAAPGRGVSGYVNGAKIYVGKHGWLAGLGTDLSGFDEARAAAEAIGQTALFASKDGLPFAMLTMSNKVKPAAKEAVRALQARGMRVAMMSSDGQVAVAQLAAELGLDAAVSDILPEGKITALDSLRRDGDVVVFVGDGIADAPLLAHADIGIVVGTDANIAIDIADVVLTSGGPAGVAVAVSASQKTMRNIRQNLVWAFGCHLALIPVAAGVLYPVFGLLLSPGLAIGAMAVSSLFVLSNALRLRKMTM